ncbi:oxidoreductase [Primorskyibacter flagellatus]|uniref:Oxidoreductase n=1 Tax=Primorskyibacter flagellatus TaxID=1387277 RepID=A0A917EDW8_9RHOB|nr:molybdopterin-dependent oxidoreductase [Primorskyibacter flagellatus]GGE23727.1 oxidoreductase [Primorskyibacter flagellatus]
MHRLILLLFCLWALPSLAADPLPVATGTPMLTITAGGDTHRLDADGLRALPVAEFVTTTIWTEGPQSFAGVRMTDLLDRLGISSGTMILTAANGYQVRVPVADFGPDGAIIAYDRNGEAMTLRDKGPLWLVYPYDSDPKFRTEIIYANSIWQLDRIEFAD